MSEDVTREPTGGQGLREAVQRWIYRNTGLSEEHLPAYADDLLALPELAALIADADNWRRATTGDPTEPEPLAMQARELLVRNRELEATVARVEEAGCRLSHDDCPVPTHTPKDVARVIRRALDGGQ